MSRRWIRLDCDWEESGWLDALTGQAAGCWPRLLCWVKLRGKGGRCKAPDSSVLARRWKVPRQAVDELIAAATQDEAITIEGDELQVTNWSQYQEPDTTATERKRKQRAKLDNGHGESQKSQRDTRDRGRDPSRDPRPPTGTTPSGEGVTRAREGASQEDELATWLGPHAHVLDDCEMARDLTLRRQLFQQYGPPGLRHGAWNLPDGGSVLPEYRPRIFAIVLSSYAAEGGRGFIANQFAGAVRTTAAMELKGVTQKPAMSATQEQAREDERRETRRAHVTPHDGEGPMKPLTDLIPQQERAG